MAQSPRSLRACREVRPAACGHSGQPSAHLGDGVVKKRAFIIAKPDIKERVESDDKNGNGERVKSMD